MANLLGPQLKNRSDPRLGDFGEIPRSPWALVSSILKERMGVLLKDPTRAIAVWPQQARAAFWK